MRLSARMRRILHGAAAQDDNCQEVRRVILAATGQKWRTWPLDESKIAGHAGCECHALVTPGALHGASEKILIEVCFGSSWQ